MAQSIYFNKDKKWRLFLGVWNMLNTKKKFSKSIYGSSFINELEVIKSMEKIC